MTARGKRMDAGWEIEVTCYSSGNAIVAPEIW